MKLEKTKVLGEIDPYFQKLLDQAQRGIVPAATSSTRRGEVAVMARVSSLTAWQALDEVSRGTRIAELDNDEVLVTGRVFVTSLEKIRKLAFVKSLKPARAVRSFLDNAKAETRANAYQMPPDFSRQMGKDVVVGIVDWGCDFQHWNFRRPDGSSRIFAIWDQTAYTSRESPFGYGQEYSKAQIDAALNDDYPYDALGYGGLGDWNSGTHGTHVADIAAGNGYGSGYAGFAPAADIVFVEPALSDIAYQGEGVVNSDLGDSVQLLEAVRYIFDMAGDRPCVVNLSLGTNGNAKDGTSLVEVGFDAMLKEQNNRAIVIAASNAYEDGIHDEGDVAIGGSSELAWQINSLDSTQNEMEIWYSGDDQFDVELIAPNGQSVGTISLGGSGRFVDDNGNTAIFISHRKHDPNNGDNVIGLFFERGVTGDWTIRLHGVQVTDGHWHAWIERDNRGPSRFMPPNDNSHTLGSVSCGKLILAVGSYDANRQGTPVSRFSSAGPTRDGRKKPEVSAPGHDVWAARSGSGDGETRKSGTSMAAPAVTGILACLLSESYVRGRDLSIAQIRDLVTNSARSDTGQWDDRYGYGRIDATALMEALNNLP